MFPILNNLCSECLHVCRPQTDTKHSMSSIRTPLTEHSSFSHKLRGPSVVTSKENPFFNKTVSQSIAPRDRRKVIEAQVTS